MKNLLLITSIISMMFLSSCVEDGSSTGKKPDGGDRNPFDFSTSKQIEVNVTYPLSFHAKVEMYTQNPLYVDDLQNYVKESRLSPIATGYTNAEGKLSLTMTVPDMTTEIFVYSSSIGAPVLLGCELNDATTISLTQANAIEPQTKNVARAGTEYWKNWAKQTLTFRSNPAWTWDKNGKINYIASKKLIPTQAEWETINNTIPEDGKLDSRFCRLSNMEITEDAEVTIYYVDSKSSNRKNTLAYYTYTGAKPTKDVINKTSTVIFPELSNNGQLNTGDGVKLQYFNGSTWSNIFPKGTHIGFVLLVNTWAGSGINATDCQVVYSESAHNKYFYLANIANRPHMAAFKAGNKFILSFEDLPWNEQPESVNRGNFRDDVFILEANPETALPPVEPGVDPENPYWGVEVPTSGILAFEDLWPYQGDYDMNDVVVKYKSTYFMNPDGYVITKIQDEFTFLHSGASFKNSFGIEYGFDESNVKSNVLTASNGLPSPRFEQGTEKATLLLFDNAKTTPKETVFKIDIVFNNPIAAPFFKPAPYNPFIIVGDASATRKEVHLVNCAPTVKADMSFFGTGNDLSDISKKIYYQSSGSYPFAFQLTGAESYNIPTEGKKISETYPKFDNWVKTNGKEDKDWYK